MKSKWQKIIIVLVQICAILVQISRASHHYIPEKDDEILSLPGQPAVNFKQYGGYISVDEKQDRALFYYLVEADSNPDSKPLLLWLTGGPGCSSVELAFISHGPFRPIGGGNLIRHHYSWNREANMLFLESPAGVGFSYSANASFYKNVNDTITAQDNLKFLEQWFLKHPKYKNRDFYVGGESYGGHFVPQLAHLLVKSRLNFNFKGIAIGNPLLEFDSLTQAEAEFFWTHGLISDSTYKLMNSICNNTQFWREKFITGSFSPACLRINSTLAQEIPASLDLFDVTGETCLSSSGHESQSDVPNHKHHSFSPACLRINSTLAQEIPASLDLFDVTGETCLSSSSHESQSDVPNHKHHKQGSDENIDVCVQRKASEYLNREAVRKALHAQLVGVTKWDSCSGIVNYDLRNLEIPTIDVVGSLLTSGIRVLIYSGDQDSRVSSKGSRALIDGLAKRLRLNTTVSYRAWFVDKQVGGWTQIYGDILTFATIRGGGHIAPFTSPKRSLALFSAFLAGKPPPKA